MLDVFWQKGFSGASLPELSAAAGITRPSLYPALGDKLSMYLRSLEHFKALLRVQAAESLHSARPLAEGLLAFYESGISLYLSGGKHPRGCLAICTAAAEAGERPEIRSSLQDVLNILDDAFAERFAAEAQAHRPHAVVDPKQAAMVASAVMHSLAVRAKAGQSRASLLALATTATAMLVIPGETAHAVDAKATKPKKVKLSQNTVTKASGRS